MGCDMSTTASVSANIPTELSNTLNRVAMAEKRSKSYYIKKGLEKILRDKQENLEDYQDAKQAYDEFVTSGEKGVPLDKVFRNIK